MKQAVAIITLSSLVLVATFSYISMIHKNDDGHGECIAASMSGTTCSTLFNAFASADFHAGVFKSFSLAVTGASILLLVLFVVLYSYFCNKAELCAAPSRQYQDFGTGRSFLSSRAFTHWLALHENSPAIL